MLIKNTLRKPDGTLLRGVKVQIEISWDAEVAPFVSFDSSQSIIDSVSETSTDLDGLWSMEIPLNSDLSPESVYKVTESISDSNKNVYYIYLDGLATPPEEGWAVDYIVAKPNWES